MESALEITELTVETAADAIFRTRMASTTLGSISYIRLSARCMQ